MRNNRDRASRDSHEQVSAENSGPRLPDVDSTNPSGVQVDPQFLLNAIGEGVHGVSLDGLIIFENPASAAMLGYEIHEMIGKPAHETIHHHHGDGVSAYPKDECPVYQTMQDGETRRVRHETFWRKNGTSLPVDLIATPTRNSNDEIIGVTVAFTDITERVDAEAAHQESEQRFRSITDAIPQLVWMTTPDGAHTYFNSRWYEFTGLSPEESLGHNWAYAFHPDDIKMAQQRWAEATESGEPYEIEYRLRDAQGNYHWVLGRALPLRDQDGTIQNWMGTCTDIDELKYALDAAKASEEARRDAMEQLEYERARLTNIFEQSPNLTAVLRGRDHVFEFANNAYYELVGHRDLIGKSVREAMPELEGQGFEDTLNNVLETGDSVRRDSALVLLQRDESGTLEKRYVDFVYQALIDHDGSRVGVICQGSDVTERHEAEERARFQADLLDAVGEAVMAISPAGQIIYWNRAAEAMYGWPASEAVGRQVIDVIPARQSRSEASNILRVLARGNRWSGEILVQDRGGKNFPVYATAAPLFNADGNFIGAVGVSNDLTQRKELEETLRQSQKLEAIGRIAGGISHDFNNVLTAIQGNAELLRVDLHHDNDAMHSVREIEKGAQSAAELTRQLLAFSRQQILQPQIISLTHVIEQMKSMLAHVLREDIELRINAPEVALVSADPTQITHGILNLGTNARDAMPDGGVLSIELSMATIMANESHSPDVPPGTYVCLTVTDTGSGMDADTKSRIWEPFFTTKPDGSGTGLGLPSVYGVVTQSGGDITVDSEPGQGTTFKIFLPAVEGTISTTDPSHAVSGDSSPPLAFGTILVCDDQAQIRDVTARILERAGYQVLKAESGTQALELIKAADHPVDLVITDVVMPSMSGPELATEIHATWPCTKVMMMSGYTGDDLRNADPVKFDSPFLEKPYLPADLLSKVEDLL